MPDCQTLESIISLLQEPFPQKDIEWRWGSISADRNTAQILPYITARAVQERLDEVFPLRWNNEVRQTEEGVICRIMIDLPDGRQIVREDVGGYPVAKDNKLAADMRFKGAVSDALKRCASSLGIGRYLYYLEIPWVSYNEKNYVPNNVIPRLPDWALPHKLDSQQNDKKTYDFGQEVKSNAPVHRQTALDESKKNLCSRCGKLLSEKEVDYSIRNLGKLLCIGCQKYSQKAG